MIELSHMTHSYLGNSSSAFNSIKDTVTLDTAKLKLTESEKIQPNQNYLNATKNSYEQFTTELNMTKLNST